MARFQYDKLTADQLRIGIALLNQESAVVEALEQAVERAVGEAVSPFGITAGDITAGGSGGGASGGARAQTTKSGEPRKRGRGRPAKDAQPTTAKRARKPRIGSEQAASRQLQGRYLAAIRSVPKSKRNHYKALVKGEGGRQGAVDAIYRDYPRQEAG